MSLRKSHMVAGTAVVLLVVLGVVAWGLSGSTLSVSVVDARTGETIPAATVAVDGQSFDASSGAISARLPLGEHDVVITADGYETIRSAVTLGFFRPNDLGTIELRNASLQVLVEENYPGNAPVSGAAVSLSTTQASVVTTEGAALIEGIPIGASEIVIESDGFETHRASLELKPGENSYPLSLTPNLEVVVERHGQAMKTNNYPLIYDLMHPDRQALWGTKTDYLDIMERTEEDRVGSKIERIEVHDFIAIEEHSDRATGKAYSDVFRVPTTYTMSSPMLAVFGMTETDFTDSDYWLLLDGQWRTLGTGERSDYMP